MAKESGRNRPVDELKEEIALSREEVSRNLRGLRYELDLPRKIRNSFRDEPLPWIATAAAVGIFIVLMATRRKKTLVDARAFTKPPGKLLTVGFALGALRIATGLLKPVIVSFVEKKVRDYTSEKS